MIKSRKVKNKKIRKEKGNIKRIKWIKRKKELLKENLFVSYWEREVH